MATDTSFYADLLSDVQVRNRIKTVEECNWLIDMMEDEIPHDELPACYDWLVNLRNVLIAAETHTCQGG